VEKERQILIKLSGKKPGVLSALKKIEDLFPLHIKSCLKENDNGEGVHIFITVCDSEA
jgi:hypothetical protein